MRRVRSEENVGDLGTKALSKAVIAKHCLTLGCQVVAMVWDFGSAVSSQQQAAGDHVQRTASRDPQQQSRTGGTRAPDPDESEFRITTPWT